MPARANSLDEGMKPVADNPQQCFEEKDTPKFEITKFVLSFLRNLICFLGFCANDAKYIKASESFHPLLNVCRREKEKKRKRERENGTRKARRSWFEKWERKKRVGGRDATRFWQTHLDDSYQTENKGSVTMNKKKPLSARRLQSLDTRQKQLYAAGAVATERNISGITHGIQRHTRGSYARRISIGDQRRPENLAFPRDSTRSFSSTGTTQFAKGESRLVTIYVSLRAVLCVCAYENPLLLPLLPP
ncbi:Uncharacterized protein DBV15_01150 [Temnothorax longispinosus]|uniref:Uncharacterized protein n=1 Tax=Temnothorax longispinosus TaxID=300112 RepID=A0A4S2J9G5_9HYME|nr:Uncharacterized protein DBV15_01150 [Temnothorax longispinosus]